MLSYYIQNSIILQHVGTTRIIRNINLIFDQVSNLIYGDDCGLILRWYTADIYTLYQQIVE